MSTGLGTGAQAPSNQQQDTRDGVPTSVSENSTVGGRQGYTDDKTNESEQEEFYDDEDQQREQQEARRLGQATGTLLNTPFAPMPPPLSSTPASTIFGRGSASAFSVPPTVTDRRGFGGFLSSGPAGSDSTARGAVRATTRKAGTGGGVGQVVSYTAPSGPSESTTQALCQLASTYIQNGVDVPPELLSAIVSVSVPKASPSAVPASASLPIIQEPITVPPSGSKIPSSTFERDPPPHLGRSDATAKRAARSGGVPASSRRVDESPALSTFDRNSFDFFACFLDLSRVSPSTSNPFYSVIASIRKHVRPSTSHILSLSRRNQWREWDHAVWQLLSQWRLIGFILPMDAAVPSGTPPWLQPVPAPDRSGTLSADESAALVAWEDLDLVAQEVLGLVVSAQVYRSLLGDLSRRGATYTARDVYAALFERYGHASWDSGNMIWEKARRMVCSSVEAVPGFVDAYIQAVREVDESVMTVPAALMVEVLLEALPRPEFACLLDDFRRLKRELGASVADLAFPDLLSWADFVLDHHRQLSASSFRTGRPPRRALPTPPVGSRPPVVVPQARQLTSSAVAAAAVAPSRPLIAGGGVSGPPRDPQSLVPGARFSSAICENCKIPGHTKAQCLKPGGDRHRAGPSFNRGYLVDGELEQDVPMGYDGDVEQEMEALVAGAQAIELDPSVQTTTVSYVVDEEEYSLISSAYKTEVDSYLAMVASSDVARRVPFNAVVDSGCTRHVLNDLSLFHDFEPVRLHVGTANSKPLVVHGKGVVRFSVRLTDGALLDVELVDCLYAPTCPVNLLSVGALTDVLKWRIMFSDKRTVCWRHEPGARPTSFLVLPRSGRLSVIACDFVPAPSDAARPRAFLADGDVAMAGSAGGHFTFVPPKLTGSLWHCRLGHPGREAVQAVLRGGVATGVESVDMDLDFKCTACIQGRYPASPFDNNGYRYQLAGELVHIDICGPFPVRTMGCRYFIILLDDATNFAWTCLLKTRDKAFGFFKFVEARLLTLVERKIVRVRLDGAAELCKGVLEGHFRERGISYQVTARYAHQQNGKAERYIRTLQDTAAVLMVASGLNQTFWGWAVKFAQYVRNRITTSTLSSGVTPYEALLGVKPDLSGLRVFGCRCYPLIPPELRRKGDMRRYEAIFLGYETDRIGWTVMGLDGKVVFAHDVIFDESTMGGYVSPRTRVALSPPVMDGAVQAPAPRRSARLARVGDGEKAMVVGDAEDEEYGLVSLFGGDSAVADARDVGRCWLALGVAEDIMRRVTVVEGVPGSPLGDGVFLAGIKEEDVGPRPSKGSSAAVEEIEDEYDRARRERVEMIGGYVDDFQAYMCVVGHKRIFDDPGEVPSSVTFAGRFRDLDGEVFGSDDDPVLAMASYDLSKPPSSYAEAMRRPDREVWLGAMRRELAKLTERGTFQPVERPEGRSLVGVKWVYDYKYNPDGSIIQGMEKARLVAQGFSQRDGEYDHTHSPVAAKESVNATYAITAYYDHELFVFDIKQAFTHSKVREEVYCRQIPGFPESDPKLVLKLCVALYGLKQAAFEWYCLFLKALLSIGLRRSEVDHAYFIGIWKESPEPDTVPMPSDGSPLRLLVPIHVDDGLASTNSTKLYLWFLRELKAKGIEVVDLGVASMFLGARIHRDRANRRLWVSQSPFITTLLEDWKMYPCNPAKVPLETMPADVPESKPGVLTDHMPYQDFTKAYQSLVGSYQYAASTYRPDIATVAMILGHHSAKPEAKHMAAAKHVMRYLYATRNYVLMFDPAKHIDDTVNSHIRAAAAFMDADWASDSTTRLSISGYAIYFMGSLIGWSSVRQRVIALSSTEAEYYAIVHAAKRVLWFRLFLMTSGFEVPSPFPMLIDNKSAISQASSPAISARSKHIHIKYLFIKNYFGDGTLTPTWVSSSVNVADIFTKLLSFPLFDRHRTALGIVPSP
ncbi:hypothetical protein EST38_g10715 [Candolleomyces aberdarensis]|uniref:Integrase catalytic domain-containing protein n=1 Tax=Candolleomyces aberdarensis TaxID=2316362 RepID=A0A4Q2D7E3_9AGAR|nr:hypothetical protein EST38_g10715 [Candolleomyces aberdarensis]